MTVAVNVTAVPGQIKAVGTLLRMVTTGEAPKTLMFPVITDGAPHPTLVMEYEYVPGSIGVPERVTVLDVKLPETPAGNEKI